MTDPETPERVIPRTSNRSVNGGLGRFVLAGARGELGPI
jgi:hypothetical protein